LSQAENLVRQITAVLEGNTDTVARGIVNMISSGTPAWKVIKDVQGIADNNYMLVSRTLGEALTDSIVNF